MSLHACMVRIEHGKEVVVYSDTLVMYEQYTELLDCCTQAGPSTILLTDVDH